MAGQESATSTHTVTRLTTPAPVVTIAAPMATLTLGADEVLLLQARAQLVSCNGTEKGQVALQTGQHQWCVAAVTGRERHAIDARAARRAPLYKRAARGPYIALAVLPCSSVRAIASVQGL